MLAEDFISEVRAGKREEYPYDNSNPLERDAVVKGIKRKLDATRKRYRSNQHAQTSPEAKQEEDQKQVQNKAQNRRGCRRHGVRIVFVNLLRF